MVQEAADTLDFHSAFVQEMCCKDRPTLLLKYKPFGLK